MYEESHPLCETLVPKLVVEYHVVDSELSPVTLVAADVLGPRSCTVDPGGLVVMMA